MEENAISHEEATASFEGKDVSVSASSAVSAVHLCLEDENGEYAGEGSVTEQSKELNKDATEDRDTHSAVSAVSMNPQEERDSAKNPVAAANEAVGPENEEIMETKEERRERRLAVHSLANFLHQIRESDNNEQVQQAATEKGTQGGEPKKLNRKERRALMKEQGFFESHDQNERDSGCQPQPVSEPKESRQQRLVLENPKLSSVAVFTETSSFHETKPIGNGFCSVLGGNNFVKSCHFSPSGAFLSTTSQDRRLRIFQFDDATKSLSPCSEANLGGLIYDSAWHPHQDVVASTSKDHPIHLWNARDAKRVTTFRGINHLDELSSAYSLSFSNDGARLFAGYRKSIRVFDLSRPGRQSFDVKTWNKEMGGQKAIISAIASHPVFDGVLAAASYGKSVALYSDRSGGTADCVFSTPFSGVTQLAYSSDGIKLFGSVRKENCIACWDLRQPGTLLFSLVRPAQTNQRIGFFLDGSDRYVLSGSSDGHLYLFDLNEPPKDGLISATQKSFVSQSAVVGVSLHPSLPVLATCSGERIYYVNDEEESSDSDSDAIHSIPSKKRRATNDIGEGDPKTYSEGAFPLQNAVHLWNITQ